MDAPVESSDCVSEEAGDGARASGAREEDTKEPGTPLLDEEQLPDVAEMLHDDAPQVDPAFEVELELYAPSSMPSTPRKSDEPAKVGKKLTKRQNKHKNRKERSPLKDINNNSTTKRRIESEVDRQHKRHKVDENVSPFMAVEDLATDVARQIHENPRVVASAINELSRQMVSSHHAYNNLEDKFGDFLRAYNTQGKNQGEILKVLKQIRDGIHSLGGGMQQCHQTSKDMHSDIQALTKATIAMGDRMEVVLLGAVRKANSSATTSESSSVPCMEPRIDRDRSDRDCDWQMRQTEGIRHLETRRSHYPHAHSPLDRHRAGENHRPQAKPYGKGRENYHNQGHY